MLLLTGLCLGCRCRCSRDNANPHERLAAGLWIKLSVVAAVVVVVNAETTLSGRASARQDKLADVVVVDWFDWSRALREPSRAEKWPS